MKNFLITALLVVLSAYSIAFATVTPAVAMGFGAIVLGFTDDEQLNNDSISRDNATPVKGSGDSYQMRDAKTADNANDYPSTQARNSPKIGIE